MPPLATLPLVLMLAPCLGLILMMLVCSQMVAWAEEPPGAATGELNNLLTLLLPALWGAVGPLVMAAITRVVNGAFRAYVPRSLQVIVSSLLGAIVAGLTGDPSSAAGLASVIGSAVTGGASQVYAATKPETLRTSAPPVTLGGPVT